MGLELEDLLRSLRELRYVSEKCQVVILPKVSVIKSRPV